MATPDKYPALVAADLGASAGYTLFRLTYSARRTLFLDSTGNRYLVALYLPRDVTPTPGFLAMFKSTDGETWTELDSGNRPSISGTTPGITFPYGCFQRDTTIYVANGGTLAIDRFNMSTNLWMSRLASGGPTTDDCAINSGQGAYARCFLGVRADGSAVVLFQGEAASSNDRAGVVQWSASGGWGSVQNPSGLLPSSGEKEYAAGLVLDSDDVAHLFFVNDSSGDFQIYHRSFKTDNTLGTLQAVDPNFKLAGISDDISVGSPAISSDMIYIPYYRAWVTGPSGVEVAIPNAKAAVDPTWGVEVLPGAQDYAGAGQHYAPAYSRTSGFDSGTCVLTAVENGTAVRGVLWLFGTTDRFGSSAMIAADFGGGWEWPRIVYNAYEMQMVHGAMVSDSRVGVLFESNPTSLSNITGLFYVEADICDCSTSTSGSGGGSQATEGCIYLAT